MAELASDEVFLADKIVDSGFGQQDGKRYYKIRWVRYTWEAEDSISHLRELLDEFWANQNGLHNIKDRIIQHLSADGQRQQDHHSNEQSLPNDNPINGRTQHLINPPASAESGRIPESSLAVNLLLKQECETDFRAGPGNSVVSGSPAVNRRDCSSAEQRHGSVSTRLPDPVSSFDDPSSPDVEEKSSFEDESSPGKEEHVCQCCLKAFSSASLLKSHVRLHGSDKTFPCETCGKCFVERSTLKRHLLIHLDDKPFKCEHCDRTFSDRSTLRRHVLTHTGHKRFECSQCDKRFTRNEHLRQHMYIHTSEKLYKCEVCGKDFRQRSTLKNHILLHRLDNTIKCDACGAMFARQQLYDKHAIWCQATSSDCAGFKCEICDKVFKESGGLKRHQLIHSGEKPFACDVCGKSFNDRSILRRHGFIHTDRKPYHCSICDKDFIRKTSLVAHVNAQHPRSAVFEFVEPIGYDIDGGEISLNSQGELQFVIAAATDVEGGTTAGSHVEVSSSNLQSEGVAILANAVCNLSTQNSGLKAISVNDSGALGTSLDAVGQARPASHTAVVRGNAALAKSDDISAIKPAGIVVSPPPDSTTQLMQFRIVDLPGGVRSLQAVVVPTGSGVVNSGHAILLNPGQGGRADPSTAVTSVLLAGVDHQPDGTGHLPPFSLGSLRIMNPDHDSSEDAAAVPAELNVSQEQHVQTDHDLASVFTANSGD